MSVGFDCPTYPYERVTAGALTFRGAEKIPWRLLRYLLDLPDANGYEPPDNNDYPRCRLIKYLWYDGARPLEHPIPTPAEKLSLLFDPEAPDRAADGAHPKGYRMFMQRVVGQSRLEASSFLKCYLTQVEERRKFAASIGVTLEIWCSVNLNANTRTWAYDRSFAMEQCAREALDGIYMSGIGTVSFCRGDSGYNGSASIYDEYSHVGRSVHFSISWAEGAIG